MHPPIFHFVVPTGNARLDRLVADATGRGRREVRQWFAAGRVRVDARIAVAACTPRAGSTVTILGDEDNSRDAPIPALRIVVATARYLVLDKPAGVHCERGKSSGSVAEGLEKLHGDGGPIGERPAEAGLVHRLDRDTSGALVAARDADEYRRLRREFGSGRTLKSYLALVRGPRKRGFEIDLPLARRATRTIVAGRHDVVLAAQTRFEPLDGGKDWTLMMASMSTGVTHQVRVHAAAAGHPLFGDGLYGGPTLDGCRRRGQLLHAFRVQVGDDIDVTVAPPGDFLAAYAWLLRHAA